MRIVRLVTSREIGLSILGLILFLLFIGDLVEAAFNKVGEWFFKVGEWIFNAYLSTAEWFENCARYVTEHTPFVLSAKTMGLICAIIVAVLSLALMLFLLLRSPKKQ